MSTDYDVVIIGGGIHGAGAAQATAAHGLTTLLIEQSTFASGTSSRSSKLIHGGLRYLESGQFSVVKACLAERQQLLKLAPQLVHLTPHYIPIYQHTVRRPWKIRTGLALYQWLGKYQEDTQFKQIPKTEWAQHPIKQQGLQALFQYWDAQTNDQLLTQAVIKSAQSLGATCLEHCEMTNATITDQGVTIQFNEQQTVQTVSASLCINAAGPWVNHVLNKISPTVTQKPIECVQGTHLIFDSPSPPGVYYVESEQDQRAIFIMPWQNKLMIGTTEHVFTGSPESVAPLNHEIDYLSATLNAYMPDNKGELVSQFSGLRVLPASCKNPFSRSRETLLLPDRKQHPNLISIYGGKLTEYRLVSKRLIDMIQPRFPQYSPKANTDELALSL